MEFFHIRKPCFAFVPGATPSALATGASGERAHRMAARHGGLWVGGEIEMSPAGVSFKASAVEESLHVGVAPVNILSLHIRSVRYQFGWLSNSIVVGHEDGEFRFRCFGAKKAAAQYSQYLKDREAVTS